MTDEQKEKIGEILREFDFDRIHKMMFASNWKWSDCEGVPSIREMKDTARYLLTSAAETGQGSSTGGFRADCEDDGTLVLSFIAAQYPF